MLALAGSLVLIGAPRPTVGHSDPVSRYIRQTLEVRRYKRADADLNGDGRKETFVYAMDQDFCGSGGCTLIVLSPRGKSYRMVMRTTVTQLPIMLLPTSTRGWRDIGVTVAGGGILRPYTARIRFDGHHYRGNPTVVRHSPNDRPTGKVLIRS